MAQTRRVPVFGSRPPCAYQSRLDEHSAQLIATRKAEKSTMSLSTILNSSYNFVDYIRNREYGMREYHSVNKNYGTRHILQYNLLKEQPIPLENTDAVLCSQWLDSKRIVFGTKCNKLMVYNVNSHKLDQIPLIRDRINESADQHEGIQSIKINPAKTLLATSAYNSNEIAVYRLPTLDPIVLAKGAHNYCIWDIEWLDDEFFVSGSQDLKFALWRVQDQYEEQYDINGDLIQPVTQFLSPTVVKNNFWAKKILFNKNSKKMLTLSENRYVHVWDVEQFKQLKSARLSCLNNVCMAMKSDSSLYAIGSYSFTFIFDSRMLKITKKICAMNMEWGIMSLSFQDNIITMGTGRGLLNFYDIRAEDYLKNLETYKTNKSKSVILKTRQYNYINEDIAIMEDGSRETYTQAIYTHCYDNSETRLFSAGGPLFDKLSGSFASLWK